VWVLQRARPLQQRIESGRRRQTLGWPTLCQIAEYARAQAPSAEAVNNPYSKFNY